MHTAQPERELMRARVVQRTRLETRLHPDRRRDRTLRHRDPPWTGGCAKRALEFNIKSGPAVNDSTARTSEISLLGLADSTVHTGSWPIPRRTACARMRRSEMRCELAPASRAAWVRGRVCGDPGARPGRRAAMRCQKQGRVVVGTRTYTRHPRSAIPPSRVCWRRGERRQQ